MTPLEFSGLPIEKKVHIILNEGREVLDRIFMFYIVKLYTYNDLYIEIWYQQIGNKIDKVQVVELDDVLHLYEKQINIKDLFKE
jgi:uncharacterized protein YaeQ